MPTWDSDLTGYLVFYLATLSGQCLALLQPFSRTHGILSRIVRCVVNWEWDRLGCEAAPVFRTLSLGWVPAGPSGFLPGAPHWVAWGLALLLKAVLGPCGRWRNMWPWPLLEDVDLSPHALHCSSDQFSPSIDCVPFCCIFCFHLIHKIVEHRDLIYSEFLLLPGLIALLKMLKRNGLIII